MNNKRKGKEIDYLFEDPEITNQKFNDRPTWQKMVLIVNLAIVFGLIFIEIFNLFF